MGCDIHCYIEYRDIGLTPYGNKHSWSSFCGSINPGRDYDDCYHHFTWLNLSEWKMATLYARQLGYAAITAAMEALVTSSTEVRVIIWFDNYIRRGAGKFDSVSFYVKDCPGGLLKAKKKARFWAKLADVNRMVVEFLS